MITQYKRVGYEEEEYKQRVPSEAFRKYKEFEDYLLSLTVENLKVYVVCAGIPYGNSETVFHNIFKVLLIS